MKMQIVRFTGVAAVVSILLASSHANAGNGPAIISAVDNSDGTITVTGDNFTPGQAVEVVIYRSDNDYLLAEQWVTANSGGWFEGFISAKVYVGCGPYSLAIDGYDSWTYVWTQPYYFYKSCP